MVRSLWKGSFCEGNLLKHIYTIIKFNLSQKVIINVWSRSSTILPFFVGLTVRVHNGNKFKYLTIQPDMSYFKFGEFAYTKRIGMGIHNVKELLKNTKKTKKK